MKRLRNTLSDMFSLIVPKENKKVYTWGEISVGLILLLLLTGAICLLPK